ncbi:exodeoxyribonuclease VII small subunit [Lapidilactobacillus mulanensis]|uniref:Exodeoxyribonuclease 7 small subunit n=1 Tax=Lapidilactobacillus mulanensis TaxID=2485999 RepID=A0ABW4DP30_9LACO|nr:exodeoxyribonuclease VII small subunit [Lapidilactobacillus mulanensis]
MATEKKSFETDLAALTEIVNELEQGNVPLETALAKFKDGITLSQSLEKTLKQAEDTLTKVVNEQGDESLLDEQATDTNDEN